MFANFQQPALFGILLLAAVLRFFQLGAADVISDEALIAFRSVGYVDYLAAPDQPTTWERFDGPVPWWAYLSFHDHPPLTFAVQWVSFQLFGVNAFALRLPFALAGLVSVWLVYLVTRRLFHESAAMVAALLVAVTVPTVWVSRIGLQESFLIMFSLLAVYWYRRALDDHRFLPAVGLALGLGLLTKYTIVAVAAALLVHFLIYRRDYFRLRTFWLGVIVFALLAAPVVVYNFMLYRLTGHFDLQLSYWLGQRVPEWQSLPGKAQIGSWPDRLAAFWENLQGVFSSPALIAVALGLALFAVLWVQSQDPEASYTLLGLLTFSWAGMLLLIGPAMRFLAPLSVWLFIMAAVVATALRTSVKGLRTWLWLGGIAFIAFELLFTVHTLFIRQPRGIPALAYAPKLRSDLEYWGYQQLDQFLAQTLAGKQPAVFPEVQYPFLQTLQRQAEIRARQQVATPLPLLIVYDANLYNLGALWTLHRRLVYDGWPVVTADQFLAQGEQFWQKSGVREVLFVQLGEGMLREPPSSQTAAAQTLAAQLQGRGVTPATITSPRLGTLAFFIYRFGLP